ncbi:MAG: type II toxin-antitoxin system VapC family toxin [Leucobacter sp.]|jgi:predicted nucleic acid-binding protein|nr:type II toxin-antitoxin system VapC family toxin [Leucobacter sp.]
MKESQITCDTSVLVAALRQELHGHDTSRAALARATALPAHVLIESYRVLTSMKMPGALAPGLVSRVLCDLGLPTVQLPAENYLDLVQLLAERDLPGGAIYDAQIAATAKHHGLTLVSRDWRAAKTYELVGVDYELLD